MTGYEVMHVRGTRVLMAVYECASERGYEGKISGVRGYNIWGTRAKYLGYEGITIWGTRVYYLGYKGKISGVRGQNIWGTRAKYLGYEGILSLTLVTCIVGG